MCGKQLTTSTLPADDVGGKVPRLGAFKLSVTCPNRDFSIAKRKRVFLDPVLTLFTTVLTQLVLVISQGTVQGSEFTQLITLVIILTFRRGRRLKTYYCQSKGSQCGKRGTDSFNHPVDQGDTLVNLFLRIRHDETMQFLVLVIPILIVPLLSRLDTAFPPD